MESKRLGPYQIVGTLGHGGMGAVYEGINVDTEERAAVKILSAALSKHGDFRQRFESEIDALRKLRHPNIVRLFGFGEQEGMLFYAMELVDGSSLEQELQRGRLFSWREVSQIGIATCGALRHAHDRGVIHRDIKPANLLLARDGQVKLSDFGIARLFGSVGLTAAGNVLGTVEFMAPEQAASQPVGPRCDLYSLGGVFFALLTGRPPFRGATPLKILEKQRSAPPEPVRRYAPQVPVELEAIISQLLEKDPEKRIPNATLLQRRLEAMMHALAHVPDSAQVDVGRTLVDENAPVTSPTAPEDLPVAEGTPQTSSLDEEASLSGPPGVPPLGAEDLAETKVTSAFQAFAKNGSDSNGAGEPATVADSDEIEVEQKPSEHFTAIAEEELDQFESREPHRPALISPQTWVLAVCLIAAGLTTWYLLQPPSADVLYQRITATTADGTVSSLRAAEDDIQEFLRLYSDDLRCEPLREYLQEIELDRLEKRFELRAKGLVDTGRLLPVERVYLATIKYAQLDPDLAIKKLEAIIHLYQDRADMSGPTGDCLQLAKRQLDRLYRQRDQVSAAVLPWLRRRLDWADGLSPADPDEARAIRQGVIELYRDKPWAAEAVRRAQDALAAPADLPGNPERQKPKP